MLILTRRKLITGAATLGGMTALPNPASASGTALVFTADAGSLAATSTTVAGSTVGSNELFMTGSNIGVLNPSDSAGNTWLHSPPATFSQGSFNNTFWYAQQPINTSASHTFSVAGGGGQGFQVSAWSGMVASSAFDTETAGTSGTGTSLATGSITPGVSNALILAMVADNWTGTLTVNSGFTILGTPRPFNGSVSFAIGWAYLIQSAPAAVNPTFSWTGGSTANGAKILSFKGTAAVTGRSRLIQ